MYDIFMFNTKVEFGNLSYSSGSPYFSAGMEICKIRLS